MLYWILKYIIIGPWLRVLFRPWLEGVENVPDKGPAMIASNHLLLAGRARGAKEGAGAAALLRCVRRDNRKCTR